MKTRIRHIVVMGIALAIGSWAAPARAIELFTNFNNGSELGNRPIGIEWLSPVRIHANQPAPLWPGRWTENRCPPTAGPAVETPGDIGPQDRPAEPIPAPQRSAPKHRASPERIEAQREPAHSPFAAGAAVLSPEVEHVEIDRGTPAAESNRDENWARGQSFLPVGAAN